MCGPWLGRKGWSLFLAREGGRPAATAILYVEDKVAYLADASCDPAFRRRGLQLALLERRINEAIAAGVDFICSGAAFQSGSHRNMERAGMRLQFVRSIWTERELDAWCSVSFTPSSRKRTKQLRIH